MTREEEINNAKEAFYRKILQEGTYYDPRDCFEEGAEWADNHPKSLREIEKQGITPGTKVSVKTKTWRDGEIDTETYFFGVSIVWGRVEYVFHKAKKDGTMSQINQYIGGPIISIRKI